MADRVPKRLLRRVRTPSVLQMEATECGAASLGILLAYYGRYVPLEELRVECRVSRDGSNALYVKKTAEKHGLSGKGYRTTAEELRLLRPPLMVFWEMNHFLIVEGFRGDRVYLNDPASGRRRVSFEEFEASYAGIAFRYQPSADFRKGGSRPSTWRAIARRMSGSYTAVAFAVLAGVALMVAELVTITFSPMFVDQILVAERHDWIRPLLAAMGLTLAFRLAMGSIQLEGLRRLQRTLASSHSARFVWHVLRLPIAFYQQRYAGDIAGRVDGNSAVADLISGPLATTIVGLLMIVFYGGVMLAFDPVLAAVGMCVGVLNLAGIAAADRLLVDANIQASHFRGRLAGSMMHAVKIIETIKAGACEHEALVRLTGHQAKVTNASQRIATIAGLLVVMPPMLSLAMTAAVLGIGGGRVIDGILSVGALLAFQTLLAQFSRPFGDLVGLGSSVQLLQAELARLDDVQQHAIDPVFDPRCLRPAVGSGSPAIDPALREPPRPLSGRLEFRDVTFGFNRTIDEPLLNRFSMTVRPGSRVALVGSSGSGKSTIGRLAAGLLRPWEGEILYDGFSLDEIPRDVFTDQVGMVDDQMMLFSGSVRENLTLWDESVSDRDLAGAAMDASVHREVIGRRGGYSARLSEGARNLSGGQRQRLEIARALIRNPALLILDEATSALDPVTEALVDDNLRRRGCTCLIIAHRLSTIRDCDEIIMLRQGKVIQRGTHDELMTDAEGFYAQLQTLQNEVGPSPPAPIERPRRVPAVAPTAIAAATGHALVAAHRPSTNGHSDPGPTALRRVGGDEPEDLVAILMRDCEVVTTAGNRPLPLDDPGAVWRVASGQVDVFYLRPESGQVQGRRHHLCRVEEGGSIFGLEGVRSAEAGGLLAVGVGPARLLKVSKADLLRLSLESEWRRDVAGLVDDWVERISRATSIGDPPALTSQLERDESYEVAASGFVTARREVLWVRPGSGGVRFLGKVDVPPCPYDSRFPLSPHGWVSFNQGETVRPWDTETLCEDGDLWEGLKRFHRVVLEVIAESLTVETASADARREGARQRDTAMVSTALAALTRPDDPGATRLSLPSMVELSENGLLLAACRAVGNAQGITIASPQLDGSDDPVRMIARASGFRTRRVKLSAGWWSQEGSPMLGRLAEGGRPVALLPESRQGYGLVDPTRKGKVRVTDAVARTLEPNGVVLYRTLPAARPTFVGLARLALPLVRGELWALFTIGLIGGLLGLVVPFAIAAAIDDVIPSANRGQLTLLCALVVAMALAIASFQAIQSVALTRLRGKLESVMLPAFWDRLLNLSPRFFARYEAGDLAVRALGPVRLIEVFASTTIASMLVSLVAMFNVIALLALNWRLGLVAVGLIAAIPLATLAAMGPIWRCHRGIAELRGEIAGLLFLLLGGIARLRVAGAEARAFARWAERYQEQLGQSLRIRAIAGRLVLFCEVWPIAILMVILGLAVSGAAFVGVGDFLAFNVAMMQVIAAMVGLSKGSFAMIDGLRECERFAPILAEVPEVEDIHVEPVRLGGAIRLDNVSFRYTPDGPLILDSVDLQVRPGEFIAVVGPSGSGKSTLLRLLLGFETPAEGAVSYDGRELATLDVQEVRRQIGVVLQDARLYPGDIYSNIVGLSTRMNRDDAWEAAELAGLAEDIEQMPMGIHTVVTEGGGGLSSGQRQRLMIARALAGRPRIILFDEATSALDNRTQAHVSRSIHTNLRGTTRVAIAHRLSTVIDADRIYVLSAGKIVQSGRYSQLIAEPGPFRDLAKRQMLAQASEPASYEVLESSASRSGS
jgi:NHLM bacteriocin system ABC transporter peptidase/ATP-binding protein/NHLM bacteriocin system ABC transporter ATP-binding protein